MTEFTRRARVFISHNHRDKPVARRVAEALLQDGHEVWLDEWEMVPGDSLIAKISEAIVDAAYLVVLLSADSVASGWVTRELETALARQINGKDIKVVPCLLDDCEIPPFLQPLLYADFRVSVDAGIEALRPAIRPTLVPTSGRSDRAPYVMDHALDWEFSEPAQRTSFLRVTLVSAHYEEPYSMVFAATFSATTLLQERLASMPEELAVWRPLVFSNYVAMALRAGADAGPEPSLMMYGADESREEETIRDSHGREFVHVAISGRRLGRVSDRPIRYFFGEIVARILEDFVADVRRHVTPAEVAPYVGWLRDNPL